MVDGASHDVVTTWQETELVASGEPRSPSALAGAAVGAVVVGVLLGLGHTVVAVVLAAVVIGLLLVRTVSPRADGVLGTVLLKLGHWVGLGLSWVAMGFVVLVVVLPVWAVTHLVRWNPLEPEPRRGRWARHRVRSWETLPHREFTFERRSLPWRTRLHGLLVIAAPLALLLIVAFPLRDKALNLGGHLWPGSTGEFDDETVAPPVGAPTESATLATIPEPHGDGPNDVIDGLFALPDEPWVAQYNDEAYPAAFLYDPFLTVRLADSNGRYVTEKDRVRLSYTPAGAEDDPDALDVWFFGSSALYGLGQRNDHTISSEVARLAEQDGLILRVQNFGVPAYQAWQDALLFGQMLTERDAPDLAVTYQGFNDMMWSLPAGSPTEVIAGFSPDVKRALRESGAQIAGTTEADDPVPHTTGTSPQNAIDVFGRSARFTRDIAGAEGVPLAQFLQPSIWTRDLPVDDASLANVGADREWHDSFAIGWNQARAGMAVDGVVDLGDSLDTFNELIYQDLVHINERGTYIVARAMYEQLRPELERLADAKADDANG